MNTLQPPSSPARHTPVIRRIRRILAVAVCAAGISAATTRYILLRAAHHGTQLIRTRQHDAAVAFLQPYANLVPWYGEISHAYGRALTAARKYDEALPVLTRAGTQKANYVVTIQKAICLEHLNRPADALKEYETILHYTQRSSVVWEGYARNLSFLARQALQTGHPDRETLEGYFNRLSHPRVLQLVSPVPVETVARLAYRLERRRWLVTHTRDRAELKKWIRLCDLRTALNLPDIPWDEVLESADTILGYVPAVPDIFLELYQLMDSSLPPEPRDRARQLSVLARILEMGGNLSAARDRYTEALTVWQDLPDARIALDRLSGGMEPE